MTESPWRLLMLAEYVPSAEVFVIDFEQLWATKVDSSGQRGSQRTGASSTGGGGSSEDSFYHRCPLGRSILDPRRLHCKEVAT